MLALAIIIVFHFCSVLEEVEGANMDTQWARYKAKFKKYYSDEEDPVRRGYYDENVRLVEQHNLEEKQGLHSYSMKINQFSDMSPDETTGSTQCVFLPVEEEISEVVPQNLTSKPVPKCMDWRKRGAVTHVKDQGNCKACWAFATVGAVESQMKIKTGNLVLLSEQNIVDCAEERIAAHGCHGGALSAGFEYIKSNEGINTEEYYPFTSQKEGEEGECQFSEWEIGATLKNYILYRNSEEHLKQIVGTHGPVAVALDASPDSFKQYNRGIFKSDQCDGEKVSHAMLVIGYGEKDGEEYWILKNSWGTNWGMKGYMHLKRNAPYMCSIGRSFIYLVV